MQPITINGSVIAASAIATEAQHHPASSPEDSWRAAETALAVRELLLQEARRLHLRPDGRTDDAGRRETDDESLIRQVIDVSVTVPEADDDTCRRYYDNNREKFRAPETFEPSHILYPAAQDDPVTYGEAQRRAEATITLLRRHPELFESAARQESACPSAQRGGRLGSVIRGQTSPAFETFLCGLEEGQLCPVPVKAPYGVHVLRLDRRTRGDLAPFDAVKAKIAGYLHEAAYHRAIAQFLRILAGRADIAGIDLPRADGPLVQ